MLNEKLGTTNLTFKIQSSMVKIVTGMMFKYVLETNEGKIVEA